MKELNAAVRAKTGQPTNPSVGPAYAIIKVAVAAIEKAGSLDRAAIRDALAATDMMTVMGQVKFGPNNARVNTVRPVIQWQGGSMELVWPANQKTKPVVYPIPAAKWRCEASGIAMHGTMGHAQAVGVYSAWLARPQTVRNDRES